MKAYRAALMRSSFRKLAFSCSFLFLLTLATMSTPLTSAATCQDTCEGYGFPFIDGNPSPGTSCEPTGKKNQQGFRTGEVTSNGKATVVSLENCSCCNDNTEKFPPGYHDGIVAIPTNQPSLANNVPLPKTTNLPSNVGMATNLAPIPSVPSGGAMPPAPQPSIVSVPTPQMLANPTIPSGTP